MELSKVQWNGRAYAEFRDYLLSFSDEKYRAFHSGLCKTSKYPIIGVRLPIMQKISSEIVKGKPLYFLMAASVQSYEEIMIRGLVTAKLKMPLAEKFVYIEEFLPYIDNWAVCDSFCTALKPKKNELYMLFEFCKEHAFSQNTYETLYSCCFDDALSFNGRIRRGRHFDFGKYRLYRILCRYGGCLGSFGELYKIPRENA